MMSTTTDLRIAFSDIRLKFLKLHTVPLSPASPRRGRGRYDSSANPPSVAALLEQILIQIISIYEERAGAEESFEQHWLATSGKLQEFGDATSYRVWKEERAHPENDLQKFLRDLRVSTGGTPIAEKANHEKWLRKATQEVTDIAIGYWIEAKNALDSGDQARALHALIECHYYVGIINSPITHSEAMRTQGRKRGQREREALEQAAVTVLSAMLEDRPKKLFPDALTMIGTVVMKLESTPEFKGVLADYDQTATAGKVVENALRYRVTDTLFAWSTSRSKQHPELKEVFDTASKLLCKPLSKTK